MPSYMDFRRIRASLEDLERHTHRIDKVTNELEASTGAALREWDGDARAQYNVERKKWDDAIGKMRDRMRLLRQALDNIHNNTLRNETRSRDRWTGQVKV